MSVNYPLTIVKGNYLNATLIMTEGVVGQKKTLKLRTDFRHGIARRRFEIRDVTLTYAGTVVH